MLVCGRLEPWPGVMDSQADVGAPPGKASIKPTNRAPVVKIKTSTLVDMIVEDTVGRLFDLYILEATSNNDYYYCRLRRYYKVKLIEEKTNPRFIKPRRLFFLRFETFYHIKLYGLLLKFYVVIKQKCFSFFFSFRMWVSGCVMVCRHWNDD